MLNFSHSSIAIIFSVTLYLCVAHLWIMKLHVHTQYLYQLTSSEPYYWSLRREVENRFENVSMPALKSLFFAPFWALTWIYIRQANLFKNTANLNNELQSIFRIIFRRAVTVFCVTYFISLRAILMTWIYCPTVAFDAYYQFSSDHLLLWREMSTFCMLWGF